MDGKLHTCTFESHQDEHIFQVVKRFKGQNALEVFMEGHRAPRYFWEGNYTPEVLKMEQSCPKSFKNEAILALLLKMLILIVMFFYLYALMAVNIYQLFIPSQQNPCQVNKIHTKILKGEVESKNTCVCTYLKIVER